MNPTDQERELQQSLQHRAEAYDINPATPLALDQVRERARSIHRRRRTGALVAVAAALAVLIPSAVLLRPGDTDAAPPVDRPSSTATPTATPTADSFPATPVTLTTHGLPRGSRPQLSFVLYADHVLATPTGDLKLPFPFSMAVPFRDGVLALESPADRGLQADWLDRDLNVVRSRRTVGSSLAVSDDGSQVAWTESTGQRSHPALLAASTTGDAAPQRWTISTRGGEVRPIGFLGQDRAVFTVVESDLSGIAEPDGSITRFDGFLNVRAASARAGLVAGQTSYHRGKSCFGVMDPATSTEQTLWQSCDWKPVEFSPDGRYLLATSAAADGLGSPSAAVLSASTGRALVTYQAAHTDPLVMYQVAWEDDDSMIALVLDKLDVSMLRLNLNGDVEQVGRTGVSKDMNLPFRFAQVPSW